MHRPASVGTPASFGQTPADSQLTSLLRWQGRKQSAAIPRLALSVLPQGPSDLYTFHRVHCLQIVCVY